MVVKNKEDLVTIVTVTYNAEDLLTDTILSIINQSYKSIEYIIIDGASTDKTIDIIKKYEDKITYWVSESDEGIYFAMNKAIKKSTGKWINFMNAGDAFFGPTTVEDVMSKKDDQSQLIYGNFQVKESAVIKKAWDQSQWYLHMPFCHQTLFTRTSLMKKELFNTNFKLAADQNFIVKMYKEKKIFLYIDKTLAVFDLGGFAESNKFLMRIESLKILLDNKVPQEEIYQSDWYKNLSKDICRTDKNYIIDLEKKIKDKEKTIQVQGDQSKQLSTLQEAVKKITNYSIWKQPLKKYKSYKKMLLVSSKIKKSLERAGIENK